MVITGLEYIRCEPPAILRNSSLGVLANPTAVTRDLVSICDVVTQTGARILALFGPEHGAWGDAAEGVFVSDARDCRFDIPVYSLYGSRSVPSDEMLAGIDIMLVDLQDVGARFYTYAHTLADLMTACGKKGIPVWVLDRPNPITGCLCEGPVLQMGYESGVGKYPIPIRHGLTLGELARFFTTRCQVMCELNVVTMRNWARDMWFDQTYLPWIAPSPNMPTLETATIYPGNCMVEGTNVSEGRGTTKPFEYIGAPWIDHIEFVQSLQKMNLPGVAFRPVSFLPCTSKYSGTNCRGMQVHVIDRQVFKPVLTGLVIVSTLYNLYSELFQFNTTDASKKCFFDFLAGTPMVRQSIEQGVSPLDIANSWKQEEESFRQAAAEIMLY